MPMQFRLTPQPSSTALLLRNGAAPLSPPMMCKSDDRIKALKPWTLTPPLKKRVIRAGLLASTTKTSVKASKKTLTKRSVRFSRVTKTRTMRKQRTCLTQEDKGRMWFQPREYAEMELDSLKNIKAFHQTNGDLAQLYNRGDDYCLRGLEMKTSPHINRLRRLRANMTVRAVLDQQAHQKRQQQQTTPSDESLAMVSRRFTQQAQNRARELGLIDSIEAQRR